LQEASKISSFASSPDIMQLLVTTNPLAMQPPAKVQAAKIVPLLPFDGTLSLSASENDNAK